jgi:hypothetical protein
VDSEASVAATDAKSSSDASMSTDGSTGEIVETTDETTGGGGCPSGGPPMTGVAAPEPGTLVTDPLAPFPASLSRTGLYPEAPDLSIVPDVAIHYEPAWPLWSTGSDKHRYLVLPAGEQVNTADPDRWIFPAGTLLFKTFLYDDVTEGCARPVETRVMRKTEAGPWEYAAYAWDAAGVDATRLDLADRVPIDVAGPEGGFVHHVPARIECRACHESAIAEVLGFERLQLSAQLADLFAAGVLDRRQAIEPIEDPDATARDVLGLFQGNCVHCHNGSGGPSSSFDLRHEVAFANTIDQPTQSSASASGIRIVPGSPETSILFLALEGETDDPEVATMPPMGVDVRDEGSIELLRAFIMEL